MISEVFFNHLFYHRKRAAKTALAPHHLRTLYYFKKISQSSNLKNAFNEMHYDKRNPQSALTNPPKMSHQSTNCVADPAKQKTSRNPYPASFEASSFFNSFFREKRNWKWNFHPEIPIAIPIIVNFGTVFGISLWRRKNTTPLFIYKTGLPQVN